MLVVAMSETRSLVLLQGLENYWWLLRLFLVKNTMCIKYNLHILVIDRYWKNNKVNEHIT